MFNVRIDAGTFRRFKTLRAEIGKAEMMTDSAFLNQLLDSAMKKKRNKKEFTDTGAVIDVNPDTGEPIIADDDTDN